MASLLPPGPSIHLLYTQSERANKTWVESGPSRAQPCQCHPVLMQSRKPMCSYDPQGLSAASTPFSSVLTCPTIGTRGSLPPLPSVCAPALGCECCFLSRQWSFHSHTPCSCISSRACLSCPLPTLSRMSQKHTHSLFQAPSWLFSP